MAKANSGEWARTAEWAKGHKVLDKTTDDVRRVSFLLFTHTGHEPAYPANGWTAACNDLWEAANHNEEILVAGLLLGEAARNEGKLSLTSPRSYKGFVRDAVARKNKPMEKAGADQDVDFYQDATQTVYRNKAGKLVIKI